MELRQLSTFYTAAQTLSFTRTATKLNYAQSTVSAQIQALEEELGVHLFDRLGKQIVLTDAGRRLQHYAEKMLTLADEASTIVAGGEEPRGTLTISAYETLCTYRLPAVLQRYRTRHPQVQLIFRPSPVSNVQACVRDGDVDIAFAMEPPFQAPDLMVEPLVREPLRIIAHPEHCLAAAPHVRPEDLDDESALLTEAGCSYRVMFERSLADTTVNLSTMIEFNNVEAIKQCVMAGMGIAILPQVAVAAEIDDGRLAALAWDVPNFEIVTQMVWHKDKWLSPALSAFLEITREVFDDSRMASGRLAD